MNRPKVVVERNKVGIAKAARVDDYVLPAVKHVKVEYSHDDIPLVSITFLAESFEEEVEA